MEDAESIGRAVKNARVVLVHCGRKASVVGSWIHGRCTDHRRPLVDPVDDGSRQQARMLLRLAPWDAMSIASPSWPW
jgi:hypothetical protein